MGEGEHAGIHELTDLRHFGSKRPPAATTCRCTVSKRSPPAATTLQTKSSCSYHFALMSALRLHAAAGLSRQCRLRCAATATLSDEGEKNPCAALRLRIFFELCFQLHAATYESLSKLKICIRKSRFVRSAVQPDHGTSCPSYYLTLYITSGS